MSLFGCHRLERHGGISILAHRRESRCLYQLSRVLVPMEKVCTWASLWVLATLGQALHFLDVSLRVGWGEVGRANVGDHLYSSLFAS